MIGNTGLRLYEMLKNEDMTDVTFMVQGTALKGHRYVVMSCGGVLRELVEGKAGPILIEDITPQTFNAVLEYVYLDVCSIGPLNVFELMHASQVLGLTDLERKCANSIQGSLNASNLGAFTEQALQFNSKDYIKVCEEYFKTNTHEIIASTGFLEVSNEVLVTLCSSESVSCSELQLFLACVEWAKSECKRQNRQETPENMRMVLGEVLTKFRFPVILLKDLLESVFPLEILPFEEVGRIITEKIKKQKRTEFLDKDRTSIVKVTVKGYQSDNPATLLDTVLSVPLSTSISQLKSMKIFYGGSRQCPADKFTLEHKGRELNDDVTLASLYTPGQDLILKLHSFTFNVKEQNGRWEFPVTMKVEDVYGKWDRIVKGYLYSYKDVHPDKVRLQCYDLCPGNIITVSRKITYYNNPV